MSKSLLSNEKKCIRCGTTRDIHKHHIYAGSFRNRSERYGCWCYLCFKHHVGDEGVHTTESKYWLTLKKQCQEEFEKKYSHEKFMEVFKRNWL